MTATDTDIHTTPDERTVEGDHDRFTHIVVTAKDSPKRATDIVMEARFNGTPIVALCGKLWVPQRDPDKFPLCKDCIHIWEEISGKRWGG